MGGALTLLSAVNVPETDAAVVWYGFPPLEYIDATKIKAPLMGHFAIDDVPFPIATVDKLEEKLKVAKVPYEFHRYKAQHAFANETAVGAGKLPITEYNAQAAEQAWKRTTEFFAKHLK
jgi:carboxymethylenebutenolidase